jgi:hypothetical protein
MDSIGSARAAQGAHLHAVVQAQRALGAFRRRGCECFSLCTERDLSRFYLRLPSVLNNKKSPWHLYLRAVYGQLPEFGPSTLELFWPNLLPTMMHRCREVPFVRPPVCPRKLCRGWLVDDEPSNASLRSWARGPRSIIRQARGTYASDPHRPFALFVAAQRPERRAFRNHSWIEVIRVARRGSKYVMTHQIPSSCECHTRHPSGSGGVLEPACLARHDSCRQEGRHYGCWLWAATGSGIFINAGSTRAFSSKTMASRHGYGTFVRDNTSRWCRRFRCSPLPKEDAWLSVDADVNYASTAALRGFDTVQILHGNTKLFGDAGTAAPPFEIVRATQDCTSNALPIGGPCIGGLRRGLGASESCHCDDTQGVVNCHAPLSAIGSPSWRRWRRRHPPPPPLAAAPLQAYHGAAT